jgi:hypothetical protein
MSFKSGLGLFFVSAIAAFAIAVSPSSAARTVPPVRNLHLTSGSGSLVKIAWDVPSHASASSATIDKYIIKRDGRKLTTLQGFNGIVDTSYTDVTPSQKKAIYEVIAVDSTGTRSPPAELSVPAPEGASPNPQPSGGDDDQSDIVQSSSLCRSIIPKDIRGHNSPTAFEKYGCGAGMNSVNDDSAPKTGPFRPVGSVKRPFHDMFQNFFIQLPVSVGHTCFLLVSALYVWVMSASTYLGIGKLFGGILQALHGNPNFPDLVILALAVGLFSLMLHIWKDDVRKGHASIARIVLAMAILTLFFSGAQTWMRFAVEKPLAVYSGITSQLSSMAAGTDVSRDFNLTVHPTFGGNKTYNAIRKAENADWLMWQYLPQCAINFGDFQWSINHYVPGTHTSFCEKFVQVWSTSSNDQKDKFTEEVKNANKQVGDFFQGKDQMTRILDSVLSKSVLFMHNVMKGIMKLSVFTGIMLLLAELLFMVGWLLSNLTGREEARYEAERRLRSMFHWLKLGFHVGKRSSVYRGMRCGLRYMALFQEDSTSAPRSFGTAWRTPRAVQRLASPGCGIRPVWCDSRRERRVHARAFGKEAT